VATTGWADEPKAADVAAARLLFAEGVKLANAGKCSDAIEPLARADKLHHAPTILGRLGECQIASGKIVEGTENLQRVVREPSPPNAPPAFVAARTRAQKALDAATPRIAHLTIAVDGHPAADLTVTVDGEVLSSALLGVSRPTDPGQHMIEARATASLNASKKITLAEGETAGVLLKMIPDPAAAQRPPPPPAPAAAASGSRTAAFVALGVGGTGLVVGSLFGALAISKRNDLQSACPGKVCQPSSQQDLDSGKTMGTVSTVGFVVGGVGLAAGATLLFWPKSTQNRAGATPQISPYIGSTGAGVVGTF